MSRFTLAEYQKHEESIKDEGRRRIEILQTDLPHDHAFDILEEILGKEDTGYIAVVDGVIELKQENSMLRDLLQDRMPVGCIAETTYQPVLEENEKLKEEIDKLKEANKKLEEENKVLTVHHHHHENKVFCMTQSLCGLDREKKKLEEQIEKLKKNKGLTIQKLKKENKKLEKEVADKGDEIKVVEEKTKTWMESHAKWVREGARLKEELKFSHDCRCSARDAYESLIKTGYDENKKLQEEVVDKEETLEQVRDYIERGGHKDELEVFDKIVKGDEE